MSKVTSAKTKGHLTKKELKQDKLVDFAYKAEAFYNKHQRLVMGIAGAIVVIIIAVVLLRHTIQSARLEESYDLTLAKMEYGSGKLDEAKPGFQKVVTEGGTAGAEAKYFLGRIAFDQGNFTQAETEFKDYLKNFSGGEELDCAVMSGLAATDEALGKDSEAATLYEEVAAKYPDNAYAPQSLLEASRVNLKLNQKDKAIHNLEQIRDKYPESAAAGQAKRDLDNLQ
jgi:TolA-binding protein